MLGRIMAGSQAVMAHDATGQAVLVAYSPPDMPIAQVLVPYGQKGAMATGRALLVIDRAVTAVALAGAFDDQGVGWRWMLDDNEHDGLESFEATEVDIREDGTRV